MTSKNGHAARSCNSCRFFLKRGRDGGGFCRRMPPVPVFTGIMGKHPLTQQPVPLIATYFPETPADGWCGEHDWDRVGQSLGVPEAVDLSKLDLAQLEGNG